MEPAPAPVMAASPAYSGASAGGALAPRRPAAPTTRSVWQWLACALVLAMPGGVLADVLEPGNGQRGTRDLRGTTPHQNRVQIPGRLVSYQRARPRALYPT